MLVAVVVRLEEVLSYKLVEQGSFGDSLEEDNPAAFVGEDSNLAEEDRIQQVVVASFLCLSSSITKNPGERTLSSI